MYRSSNRPGNEARNASAELLLELALQRGRKRKTLRDALRQAIQEGRLTAHTVLPASRRLAADLGVSRGVVTDAYDQLVSEGYLEVAPRSAPAVAPIRSAPLPASEPPAPVWRFDLGATTPDVTPAEMRLQRGRYIDSAGWQTQLDAVAVGVGRGWPRMFCER